MQAELWQWMDGHTLTEASALQISCMMLIAMLLRPTASTVGRISRPVSYTHLDELGLLVFTEMPGWRYIGDESWKAQALQNCREMVCQCRNHPSIF